MFFPLHRLISLTIDPAATGPDGEPLPPMGQLWIQESNTKVQYIVVDAAQLMAQLEGCGV
jgi:hypothetical protein